MTGTPADWSHGMPLMAGDWFIGLYQPSPETVGYWEAVARRELVLKYSPAAGRWYHPKRIVCTETGSTALEWRRASGRGTVYSFSEVHRAPSAVFAGSVPYTVGLVALEEGVHLFTRFIADAGPIAIGAPARVDFQVLEGGTLLPVFRVGAAA
ncbi:MAG TPA: OB-fold domain-containing protein [Roseomonas sp.]|nr:OB-fold domain-containing protein [Roseomonas sp.]